MSSAGPILKVAKLVTVAGVLGPRDLDAHGIARQDLRLAEQQGLIVRSGRGHYTSADAPVGELYTIAEVSKRVPRGVACLLSALRFHDIGTQSPFNVWIAIGEKDRRQVADIPPVLVFRFSTNGLVARRAIDWSEIRQLKGKSARRRIGIETRYRYRHTMKPRGL